MLNFLCDLFSFNKNAFSKCEELQRPGKSMIGWWSLSGSGPDVH